MNYIQSVNAMEQLISNLAMSRMAKFEIKHPNQFYMENIAAYALNRYHQ
ncbi:MAG: hypothetical protein ACQJCO_08325 [cyanobacterium endosymbiont of Rhopalodia sterrenbergii]